MGSEKSVKVKGRRSIPLAYGFGHRRYEFVASFLQKRTAAKLKKSLEKNGYMSRIKEFTGIWAVFRAVMRS